MARQDWKRGWSRAACVTLLSVLSACGGGGDSSTATTTDSTSTAQALAAASTTSRGAYTSAPVITTNPASAVVSQGGSVSLNVVAYGAATLTYQWRKGGSAISGATSATYTISSAATSDAGSYDVVVTNSKGSATSTVATLVVSTASGGTHAAESAAAANAFLATLSSSQLSSAQRAYSLDAARHWSNLPNQLASRYGINWGSLSTAQQTAARTLITTAVGETGNAMHLGWQAADNYLFDIGGDSMYGEGQYFISVLGSPSATGFWILQLTGHHLTYNITFNGTYKSGAPAFIGIEPKDSFTYGGVTYDPMQAQRDALSNLGAVLTGYSAAKLSGTYSDLVFGANGSGGYDGSCPRAYSTVTEHGVAYSALSEAHQALVRTAISAYVNSQAGEVASDMLSAYLDASALAGTYVAYTGTGTLSANGNYFRIEGPRVWIELSVQRGVVLNSDIHYHGVWRDKQADYGGACGTS